jgi:integrase
MGKRGNNEGMIRKRDDGRWEARVSLPDGKRKSFYGKTRQEVAQQLIQAQHDLAKGLPVVAERQTVEQYLTSWLEVVKTQVRASSYRRCEDYVRLHLVPKLGKVVLSKLTAQQVQGLYSQKLKEGLSARTVHHLHVTLHHALKDAFRLGLVQRNVAEMVKPPRPEHREMRTLTAIAANHLLDVAQGDRFEALYVLALTTGMRRGELLALRWQDIDLEQRSLQVKVSLQESGSTFIVAEPKTAYSRRRILLSQAAVDALRAHRIRQNEERLLLGPVWQDNDLVFPNQIGKLMDPSGFVQMFKQLLVKAGLPPIRFHDLRHTAATLLLERGVMPKTVSEMLGHSSVKITLDLYGHVTPRMQQAVADTMDTLFKKLEERELKEPS